jgi:hypothetical protein
VGCKPSGKMGAPCLDFETWDSNEPHLSTSEWAAPSICAEPPSHSSTLSGCKPTLRADDHPTVNYCLINTPHAFGVDDAAPLSDCPWQDSYVLGGSITMYRAAERIVFSSFSLWKRMRIYEAFGPGLWHFSAIGSMHNCSTTAGCINHVLKGHGFSRAAEAS